MDDDRFGGRAAVGVIESDPAVMAGTPVFAGTDVPVQAFLNSIEGGWSLDEFLERFPSVRREQLIEMLRQGTRALLAQSGHAPGGASPIARNKADVLERISGASKRIRAFGVRQVALFGSFVRGEQRSGSDVDLLVDFEAGRKNLDNFMGLVFFLEELLGRKVQVVTPDGLSPYVGPHILKEAQDVPLAA
jgi:predicted nucleotidyltransferase/uncharacterized protein (DUF433 family)